MIGSDVLAACIFSLILVFCYFGNKYLKFYRNYKLSNCVAWCATTNSAIYRCNMSLSQYIRNTQSRIKIPSEYSISGDSEWAYVNTILAGFSDNLVQSFLGGKLIYTILADLKHLANRYGTVEEHFFMFQLFCYLSDHYCDSAFLGNDMHLNTISRKNHGTWGTQLYEAKYELTDFAVVIHKLRYITFLYCRESEIYKRDIAGWLKPNHFTDVLESRTIEISRM